VGNAGGGWAVISYAQEDADVVRRIAGGLRVRGVDVWIDWEDIGFGDIGR
jgi:TIR domain